VGCDGSTVKFTFLNLYFNGIRNSGSQRACVLLLNPLIPEFLMLMYFFSQLGDYPKAFEHLGNALTYDPGNYKVS